MIVNFDEFKVGRIFKMLDLKGKVGLVFGVANHRSIAWSVAQTLLNAGAELALSVLDERAQKKAQALFQHESQGMVEQCDISQIDQLKALIHKIKQRWGRIDFIVHSIAFADIQALKNPISTCSREAYLQAMDISAFSLLSIVNESRELLSEQASIVTLSYLGAEIAIPSYGLMGPVKAALEAEVRYLAAELGSLGMRANVVSAGPLKTLAASAIPGFKQHLKEVGTSNPRGRGIEHQEVANVVCFLCSSMSSGINAEVIHVDAGQHAVRAF